MRGYNGHPKVTNTFRMGVQWIKGMHHPLKEDPQKETSGTHLPGGRHSYNTTLGLIYNHSLYIDVAYVRVPLHAKIGPKTQVQAVG